MFLQQKKRTRFTTLKLEGKIIKLKEICNLNDLISLVHHHGRSRQTDTLKRSHRPKEHEQTAKKLQSETRVVVYDIFNIENEGGRRKIHDGTLWKVYGRARRRVEWEWCDRASAHCQRQQIAQVLNQPPYSQHVLQRRGEDDEGKHTVNGIDMSFREIFMSHRTMVQKRATKIEDFSVSFLM